ncbi:hypothetical protein NECAME_12349, partial [Necator americanus]
WWAFSCSSSGSSSILWGEFWRFIKKAQNPTKVVFHIPLTFLIHIFQYGYPYAYGLIPFKNRKKAAQKKKSSHKV